MFIQNCITTMGTVPLLIFAREKPPTPPSESASRKQEPLDFKKELKVLVRNKSYLLLCVSFTLLYGVYTSLGAVVSAVTKPYGYESKDNAIFGGTFIFCGVTGSFVLGMVLDRTQKFKLMINCVTVSSVIFISASFFTLPYGSVLLFSLNLAFIGFSVIPIIPISYAFAVELTFPCPEAMSNGMMILPSQIFGASLGVIAGMLCEAGPTPKDGPLYAVALFLASCLISVMCSFFIKEELRRLRPKRMQTEDAAKGVFDSSGQLVRVETEKSTNPFTDDN
jgi:predicted MFS family arabinose efflux permease